MNTSAAASNSINHCEGSLTQRVLVLCAWNKLTNLHVKNVNSIVIYSMRGAEKVSCVQKRKARNNYLQMLSVYAQKDKQYNVNKRIERRLVYSNNCRPVRNIECINVS